VKRNLALIVEGHGEVHALPVLLRRLIPHMPINLVGPPYRMKRSQMRDERSLTAAVEFAVGRTSDDDGVLIVLDADDDCAVTLGNEVLRHARAAGRRRRVGVVVANREYEAWLVAGAPGLAGKRGLPPSLAAPDDADALRNPKAWLAQRMPHGYRETLDQPALSQSMDLVAARKSRSFRKFVKEVTRLVRREEKKR
jgi:hypothetical protein